MRRLRSAFVVSCLLLYGCGSGGSGGAPAPAATPTRRPGQATATPGPQGTRTPTRAGQVTHTATPGPQGTRTPTPPGQRTRTHTPTPEPGSSQTLYVRESGSDNNPGTSPGAALRTLTRAAELLEPGTTVYVGRGRYTGRVALNGGAGTAAQPIEIIGDVTGAHTGDGPGTVTIDADGDIVALIITRSTFVTVDSFLISGALPQTEPENASATAIQLRGSSDNATIRNCVIANAADADGIRISGSSGALVFNNLLFRNDRGILITGDSQHTRVINNTIIAHQRAGIALTLSGGEAPTDTMVLNNVVQGNETDVAISVAQGPPSALDGYQGDFNAVFEPGVEDQSAIYNPTAARGEHDINDDPLLRNVGQGDVHLLPGSPAIDAGTDTIGAALVNALQRRSTTPDNAPDSGPVDMGYHYPR